MRKRAESKRAESSKVKAERKNKAQSKEAESSRLKGKILAQRQLEAQNQRMNEENFMQFGYENLEVWNKAVDFAVKVIDTVENISTDRKHYRLLEQIESSSTSVPMNIAEGKGRFSKKEFIQYCYIARGSLYETMTILEIFRRVKWITDSEYKGLESDGIEIASMIKGLINSLKKS